MQNFSQAQMAGKTQILDVCVGLVTLVDPFTFSRDTNVSEHRCL